MPPILDTAIGTVFVFLLFSLVVSALNELILSRFDQRAKFLHMGLQELFGEADWSWRKGFVAKASGGLLSRVKTGEWTEGLYKHGLIKALSRTDGAEGTSPSYIPAGAFVTALLDLISQTSQRAKTNSTESSAPATPTPTTNGREIIRNIVAPLVQWLGLSATSQQVDGAVKSLDDAAAVLKTVAQAQLKSDQTKIDEFQKRIADAGSDPTKLLGVAQELEKILIVPAGDAQTSANVEAWIENLNCWPGSSQLHQSVRSLFLSVGKDVEKFKIALEGWFNAAMDRVSGWYKRFTQKWMIFIGFILAATLNVDTIRIVQELSRNPNLAKAVAAQAEGYTKGGYKPIVTEEERRKEVEKATVAEKDKVTAAISDEEAARRADPKDSVKLEAATQARKDAQAALDKKRNDLYAAAADSADTEFRKSIADLQHTGIPMGWGDAKQRNILGLDEIQPPPPNGGLWSTIFYYPWVYAVCFWTHLWQFVPLIFGWFLTALAASLGAPFWFDTLSRFVNIRNAGRPPSGQDSTSTATKPPPASLDKAPTSRSS